MKLTFEKYRNKVKACWLGKNIGGTLGAPFECRRGVYDIEYYTHDLSKGVLPNDDLDLQLVWLNAAENYGRNVNAEILGEYWLSYIVPDWSEYGAGKNNMRYGLMPPISGWYANHNKDSCGCFIRSEIWACLAPGHPEISVKYAYEDGICDHADEGVYGELFCAAIQSAAFVESDLKKLVEIGKKYIPADCGIVKAVDTAFACHEKGLSWKEARKAILQTIPGSFGMLGGYRDQEPEADVPVGKLGYDAPSNIGLMMVGWIYGEGDFSKSICIAAGCCEDADCTAGTLGAILGIIHGTDIIEEKWLLPIGDEIKTISLDLTKDARSGFVVPRTVSELTRRVVNLMPTFLYGYYEIGEKGILEFTEIENVSEGQFKVGALEKGFLRDKLLVSPVSIRKSNALFEVCITYEDGSLDISAEEKKKFKMRFYNKLHSQQWLEMKLHIPQEWLAFPGQEMSLCLNQLHGGHSVTESSFEMIPQALSKGRYEVCLEIRSNGRLSSMYIPITLLTAQRSERNL